MVYTGKMKEIDFTKTEGLGNDFIIIDDRSRRISLTPAEVRRLCDRHFGIGADGLILLGPGAPPADLSWDFFNADGSVAEMCGNGIRCIGAYVVERGLCAPDQEVLVILTAVGARSIRILRDREGHFEAAAVSMGNAELRPEALSIEGTQFTCVSMGNPHAVTFVDDVSSAPLATLGPLIETDAAFPQGANVGFCEVGDRASLKLRVWERGVGETLACGTGACAAAVAAHARGLCGPSVTVQLPGGALDISIEAATLAVTMTGPARIVYEGSITL